MNVYSQSTKWQIVIPPVFVTPECPCALPIDSYNREQAAIKEFLSHDIQNETLRCHSNATLFTAHICMEVLWNDWLSHASRQIIIPEKAH